MRWEPLWSAEKSREKEKRLEMRLDGTRWNEMRWCGKPWETPHDTRWDGMRWDGMTQTAVTMGCHEQVPRKATTRWDLMIIWWNKKRLWKDMAPEQVKRLLLRSTASLPAPRGTVFVPLYRLLAHTILKLPTPACPGTTCMEIGRHTYEPTK